MSSKTDNFRKVFDEARAYNQITPMEDRDDYFSGVVSRLLAKELDVSTTIMLSVATYCTPELAASKFRTAVPDNIRHEAFEMLGTDQRKHLAFRLFLAEYWNPDEIAHLMSP